MTRRLPAGLVRRAVVIAGLVLCVVVVVMVVEGVAAAAGGRPGTWGWLGGAALVALVVPLVQPRLERLADRVAYGRDGDPYAVLAGFVQRISETLAVDDVLPQLARTAVQATRGSSGGVRLWLADGAERHETWPPGVGQSASGDLSLVLEHAGEQIGRLEVSVADDVLREVDRELLNRLAGPAGLALSNVRLTLELRQRLNQTIALTEQIRLSRQRLLETGRDQRQRFVTAVRRRVLTRIQALDAQLLGVAAGASTLGDAEAEARAGLEALRELAAGVYPPALTERGVGAALDWHFDRHGEPVVVRDEIAGGQRHPPAVESAAYFCCVAVTDEAGLAPASIRLTGDAASLSFEIGAADLSASVEQLVRDRVEALGGELTVSRSVEEIVVQGSLPVSGPTLPAVIAGAGRAAAGAAAEGSESP